MWSPDDEFTYSHSSVGVVLCALDVMSSGVVGVLYTAHVGQAGHDGHVTTSGVSVVQVGHVGHSAHVVLSRTGRSRSSSWCCSLCCRAFCRTRCKFWTGLCNKSITVTVINKLFSHAQQSCYF